MPSPGKEAERLDAQQCSERKHPAKKKRGGEEKRVRGKEERRAEGEKEKGICIGPYTTDVD